MESTDSRLLPARNIPLRILRAIDAALHLAGIPRCIRLTFAELARHVPQAEPFATVFAHKERIAKRISAAESTVYRHLAALVEAQLIERLPQERKSRNGRFSVARVRLTQKGAELLGLSVDNSASPSPVLSAGHTLTEPTDSKNQPQRPGEVPADLAVLATKGIRKAGIFFLMGKASKHGKRLSDIVTAKGEHLRERYGKPLFGYLVALAEGPTCFATAAAAIREREKPRQYAHRRYAGPGGLIVRTFGNGAEVLRDGAWLETVPARDMPRVYAWIESGKLREISL